MQASEGLATAADLVAAREAEGAPSTGPTLEGETMLETVPSPWHML